MQCFLPESLVWVKGKGHTQVDLVERGDQVGPDPALSPDVRVAGWGWTQVQGTVVREVAPTL